MPWRCSYSSLSFKNVQLLLKLIKINGSSKSTIGNPVMRRNRHSLWMPRSEIVLDSSKSACHDFRLTGPPGAQRAAEQKPPVENYFSAFLLRPCGLVKR